MSGNGLIHGGLVGIILIFHAAAAVAQDERGPPPTSRATPAATTELPETLKERLSDKASDAQRVDNCKVPPDRRGPVVRPAGCRHDDAGAAPSARPR
jgi:hypothetical protein